MADPEMDALTHKVDAINTKLDALSASVDERFTQFDAHFAQVDARFTEVDTRFTEVDTRFAQIDASFVQVAEHFAEQREYTEFGLNQLRAEMRTGFRQLSDSTNARFDRLERKLDQFIDTQISVNRSDHTRLLALERARQRRKR